MVLLKATLSVNINETLDNAIAKGIVEKRWKSRYAFLQQAINEKLIKDGLISFDEVTFIHYHCNNCNRELYVSPEVAGLFEWLYCTICYQSPPQKEKALVRNGTILGKNLPPSADIRRW